MRIDRMNSNFLLMGADTVSRGDNHDHNAERRESQRNHSSDLHVRLLDHGIERRERDRAVGLLKTPHTTPIEARRLREDQQGVSTSSETFSSDNGIQKRLMRGLTRVFA